MGLRRFDPLYHLVELLVGADPVELGRRVHLDRVKALRLPARRRLANLVRPVAADPCVGADLVAHLAAEHLPRRQAKRPALEVPKRLLEAGKPGHDHCAAAVEAAAVADLPNVFDVERVDADEAIAESLEHAFDRFRPAFQARFAPAEGAITALDADEQPPRRDQEGLDLGDLPLGHTCAFFAWVPLPPSPRPAASS